MSDIISEFKESYNNLRANVSPEELVHDDIDNLEELCVKSKPAIVRSDSDYFIIGYSNQNKVVNKIKKLWNHPITKFNRSMIPAEIASVVGAAKGSSLVSLVTNSSSLITVGAAITEGLSYFGIYRILSYFNNENKYKGHKKKFWKDFGTFSKDSVMLWTLSMAKNIILYKLLKEGYDPAQTTAFVQAGYSLLHLASMNALAYKQGLIDKNNNVKKVSNFT